MRCDMVIMCEVVFGYDSRSAKDQFSWRKNDLNAYQEGLGCRNIELLAFVCCEEIPPGLSSIPTLVLSPVLRLLLIRDLDI